MEYLVNPDRRTFLRRGAMGAGAVWALSLQELSARAGHRGPRHRRRQPLRADRPKEGRDHGPGAAEAARRLPLQVVQLDWRLDDRRRRLPEPSRRHGRRRRVASRTRADADDTRPSGVSESFRPQSPATMTTQRPQSTARSCWFATMRATPARPIVAGRPDITYAPTGVPTARRHDQPALRHEARASGWRHGRASPAPSATAPAA